MDQYGLIHCGLAAIKHTKERLWIWTNSFKACNLDPEAQVEFDVWIGKISQFLQGGDTFKRDRERNAFDGYKLLPPFWHAMNTEEKSLALTIVQTHSEPWSVDCILMLKRECKVVMSSMSALQTCITLAIEDPSHLRRGIPAEDAEEEERVVDDEEAAAEEQRVKADHGLTMLKRVPDHLSGMELFEHQVRFR